MPARRNILRQLNRYGCTSVATVNRGRSYGSDSEIRPVSFRNIENCGDTKLPPETFEDGRIYFEADRLIPTNYLLKQLSGNAVDFVAAISFPCFNVSHSVI